MDKKSFFFITEVKVSVRFRCMQRVNSLFFNHKLIIMSVECPTRIGMQICVCGFSSKCTANEVTVMLTQ